jgi:hypothetical protein
MDCASSINPTKPEAISLSTLNAASEPFAPFADIVMLEPSAEDESHLVGSLLFDSGLDKTSVNTDKTSVNTDKVIADTVFETYLKRAAPINPMKPVENRSPAKNQVMLPMRGSIIFHVSEKGGQVLNADSLPDGVLLPYGMPLAVKCGSGHIARGPISAFTSRHRLCDVCCVLAKYHEVVSAPENTRITSVTVEHNITRNIPTPEQTTFVLRCGRGHTFRVGLHPRYVCPVCYCEAAMGADFVFDAKCAMLAPTSLLRVHCNRPNRSDSESPCGDFYVSYHDITVVELSASAAAACEKGHMPTSKTVAPHMSCENNHRNVSGGRATATHIRAMFELIFNRRFDDIAKDDVTGVAYTDVGYNKDLKIAYYCYPQQHPGYVATPSQDFTRWCGRNGIKFYHENFMYEGEPVRNLTDCMIKLCYWVCTVVNPELLPMFDPFFQNVNYNRAQMKGKKRDFHQRQGTPENITLSGKTSPC